MTFQDASLAAPGAGISLLLRVRGVLYRASGTPGSAVAPCPAPVAVPGSPPWLRGLVLHEGEARPLVDLGMALDEDATPAGEGHQRMLVTTSGGYPLALLVDDVEADDGRAGPGTLDLDALSRELLVRAAAWAAVDGTAR